MTIREFLTDQAIFDFCTLGIDLVAIAAGTEVQLVSESNDSVRHSIQFQNEVLSVRPWQDLLMVCVYSTENAPWVHLLSYDGRIQREIFLDCDDFGVCDRLIATRRSNLIELSEPSGKSLELISKCHFVVQDFETGYFSDSLGIFLSYHKNSLVALDLRTGESNSIELEYEPDHIQMDPSGEIVQTIHLDQADYFTIAELTRVAPIPVNRTKILSWVGNLKRQRIYYSTLQGVFCFDLKTAFSNLIEPQPSYSIQIAKGDQKLLAEFGNEDGGSTLRTFSI